MDNKLQVIIQKIRCCFAKQNCLTEIDFHAGLRKNMLTSYMDVNLNKYSNVPFLPFVCSVFISSNNHIQVLDGSSKAGAALVKTITSYSLESF